MLTVTVNIGDMKPEVEFKKYNTGLINIGNFASIEWVCEDDTDDYICNVRQRIVF